MAIVDPIPLHKVLLRPLQMSWLVALLGLNYTSVLNPAANSWSDFLDIATYGLCSRPGGVDVANGLIALACFAGLLVEGSDGSGTLRTM